MRRLPVLHAACIVLAFTAAARAQTPAQTPAQTQAQTQAQTPPGLADTLANLADQQATHTGFILDRSEIEVAQTVLQSAGVDAAHSAAALTSLSFDTFHYTRPAFYTPEAMAALLRTYKAAGWKHLVNATASPATSAQPAAPITDLWLHYTGADIDHVTVLIRAPKMMNVIQVAGELRPIDLLHLSGHFGIPRVDPSAIMVPDPH